MPLGTREWSTVGQRAGENGLICPRESPGSVNNEYRGAARRDRVPLGSLATLCRCPAPLRRVNWRWQTEVYEMENKTLEFMGNLVENGQRPVGDGQRGMVASGRTCWPQA